MNGGEALAWFLAQHKLGSAIGHKVMTSVTIFLGDKVEAVDEFYTTNPNVLWEVKDYESSGITEVTVQDVIDQWHGKDHLPHIACPQIPIAP